ncbi:hypothetical protein BO85DRAFT_98661 [Aspergillus piperis CBS 112811]|uniref:Uncharacterized protein n=1 Tax=Aspergillus piperis CBS 112811 TaxID=1448313 RepID=A0A8G1VLI5_9EURO|nr:hypothetical protein BO85DRAFT_98661 [Aspergillus piperis CBS 112811]RAH54743.1 hypothetical protein BO85DRAFT_98661 [Aspergillus piperis CBS 112811]
MYAGIDNHPQSPLPFQIHKGSQSTDLTIFPYFIPDILQKKDLLLSTIFELIAFIGGNDQIGLCGWGFSEHLRSTAEPPGSRLLDQRRGFFGTRIFSSIHPICTQNFRMWHAIQREIRRYEVRQENGRRSKSKIASRFMSFLVIRVHVARYVWLEAKGSSIR